MASTFLDRVSNKALGELLIEKGALSEAQVKEALDISRNRGIRLGEALIFLGYISRDALGYAIGEQYGLRPMELQPSMVDPLLVSRFDCDLLISHNMLPLIELGTELIVVVPDPNEQQGLEALARLLPDYTITPQLGAADQIARCLETVKLLYNLPSDADNAPSRQPQPARQIPRFSEIPAPDSEDFPDWLIGLAASQHGRDVVIRDLASDLQVSLMPTASENESKLTEVGRWPNFSTRDIQRPLLRNAANLEYTCGQAARLDYTITHDGSEYDFLILTPIIHDSGAIRIRSLRRCQNASAGESPPVLEPGRFQLLPYDENTSLEDAVSTLIAGIAADHQVMLCQQFTRCVFANAAAWPAPFANITHAAQAVAATCVIFDYPPSYREIINLTLKTSPPPAVVIFVPQGDSSALSPDVEELISRAKAQPQGPQSNTKDIRGNE